MRYTIFILLAVCYGFISEGCQSKSEEAYQQDDMVAVKPAPAIKENTPVKRPVEVLDLTDEIELFVVVAGAYSSSEGAERKAKELQSLGYKNADIIQRPGSKLYSALVERFDNEEAAEAFSKELMSNDEIKSYVYQVK